MIETRVHENMLLLTIRVIAALFLLGLVFVSIVSSCGCQPSGPVVVYEPRVSTSPSLGDVWRAADLTALRWKEMRPKVSAYQARAALEHTEVHFSSTDGDFPKLADDVTVQGWNLNDLIFIRSNEERATVGTDSLVHEWVHTLLLHNGEDTTHSGPAWTPEMYAWIQSVMTQLQ